MFIMSLKASKLKYLVCLLICGVLAAAVVLLLPDTEHSLTVNGKAREYEQGKIRFDGIKGKEGVIAFAESIGFELDADVVEIVEIKIPSKPDAVLEEYNKLQKSQGFNLMKYKNKNAERYTFRVKDLPDEQSLPDDEVLFTVIVSGDKIIGGDVFFTGKDEHVTGILK